MAANKRNAEPQFNMLRNSNLVCADCVLAHDDDLAVAICHAFPDIKPTKVLDGGECDKHMTMEQAMKKYGPKTN